MAHLDPIRKKFGDHADGDSDDEDYDPIKSMDREQLELTINKQRDAIEQMKVEIAMMKKSSKSKSEYSPFQ